MCGSELSPAQLEEEALPNARSAIRDLSKLFALKNMAEWVRALHPQPHAHEELGESVACNAMMIAEAVVETPIALLALQHGALRGLQAAYTTWLPRAELKQTQSPHTGIDHNGFDMDSAREPPDRDLRRDGTGIAPSDGTRSLSYTGAPAATRIVDACRRALASLAKSQAEMSAIKRLPEEDEARLPGAPLAFRNVFKGQCVHSCHVILILTPALTILRPTLVLTQIYPHSPRAID